MNPQEYKKFLLNYLGLLEKLTSELDSYRNDSRFVANLRVAERSFNFLTNFYPMDKVREEFGMEEWNEMKNKRDSLAAKLSEVIESNPELKKRYEEFCENLKNLKSLGANL